MNIGFEVREVFFVDRAMVRVKDVINTVQTLNLKKPRYLCSCVYVAITVALLPTVTLAKDLDLSRSSSTTGVTRVGFCARPSPASFGFPGHAFVAFIEESTDGTYYFRAVGHTVASGTSVGRAALTYLGAPPIDGKLAEERYTDARQECLNVTVDRSAYERAVNVARPTLALLGIPDADATYGESYSLNESDCIDYVAKVADALRSEGLNVPARGALDTPIGFIRKLSDAN